VPFRLRPRDTRLAPDLTRLCDAVLESVRVLSESVSLEPEVDADLARRATAADSDAEEAMHAVLRELASALVTPIDRTDVFRLAASVRDCSRAVLDAVELVTLLGPVRPTEAIVEELQYVQLAADVTAEAVPRFGRKRLLTETWIELGRLRKQSAARHRRSLVDLLDGRPGSRTAPDGEQVPFPPDPAACARLLQVETALQGVMRAFDTVGHVLQLIVVKEG